MPLGRGDKEYSIPLKGINTEAPLLHFPPEYSPAINNIVVETDPIRLAPRKGIKNDKPVGTLGDVILALGAGEIASSVFLWEKPGGDINTNFLVVQMGTRVIFLDAQSTGVDMTSPFSTYLDLSNIRSGTDKGTLLLARNTPLQYSTAKGHLTITSEAIDPTIIRYNVAAGTLSFTKIDLKVRDTIGLESGIEVDKRPTAIGDFPAGSTASGTYPALSEEHEYNLYNQGWYQQRRLTSGSKTVSDPIAEFNTQNSEYPSNADIVYIGMVDSSGDLIFDAELLKDQTFGTTPTARGHYVTQAFNIDRETPRTTPLVSGVFTGGGGADGGTNAGDWTDIPGSS